MDCPQGCDLVGVEHFHGGGDVLSYFPVRDDAPTLTVVGTVDTFCCWRRRNGYACPCPQATGAQLDAAARDPMDLAGAMNEAFKRAWAAGKPAILADPPMLRCGHAHFPTVQPPSWLDDRCRDAIRGAWHDHYAPDPTARAEGAALGLRRVAEARVQPLLEDDATAALAFHILRKAGWDTDRATRVLKSAGWLL